MLMLLPLHGVTCVTWRYSIDTLRFRGICLFTEALHSQARFLALLFGGNKLPIVTVIHDEPAPITMFVKSENPPSFILWIPASRVWLFQFINCSRDDFKRDVSASCNGFLCLVHDTV